MATQKIPAHVEPRFVMILLCSIIGGILLTFILSGCIAQFTEMKQMTSCVENNGNWVNSPGGPECLKEVKRNFR
jgi:hypothetical protein